LIPAAVSLDAAQRSRVGVATAPTARPVSCAMHAVANWLQQGIGAAAGKAAASSKHFTILSLDFEKNCRLGIVASQASLTARRITISVIHGPIHGEKCGKRCVNP
jgi:hypothetical protein